MEKRKSLDNPCINFSSVINFYAVNSLGKGSERNDPLQEVSDKARITVPKDVN